MDKKLKIFRYVIANAAIVMVVVSLLAFTITGSVVSANNDLPIYKGVNSDNKVSLMVNVYWGTEYLDSMLKTLADNNVKTTFFVGGTWAAQNESELKKIYDAGHEIGNHGYFHKDHKKLDETRNKQEISATHQLVKSILSYEMKLFAPPSGSFSKITLAEAEKLGYTTIMWSRDTVDWRDHDTEIIFTKATKKTESGDLILMHPTLNTAKALDRIIKALAAKGLAVSTVSEVIADK